MQLYLSGESFLNELYSNMHNEEIVSHHTSKSDSPEQKIATYINRLESIHNKAREKDKMGTLMRYYYDKYIIKELPETYSKENDSEMLSKIQIKQKEVLDQWVDYLTSSKCNYPMWFKSYVFRGMVEMDNELLNNHNDSFLELNEEAISNVYDVVYDYIEDYPLIYEQQQALTKGKTFGPIYLYYINAIKNRKEDPIIDKRTSPQVEKKTKKILRSLFGF